MKKNNFMEGAIIATIAIIVSKVLGILYVIPFYKIIGEKGGALYGYAYNIYNIFLIISSAGIPLAISKITSEYETKKEYENKMIMFQISKRIIYIFSLASFLICFIFAGPIAKLVLGNLSQGNTIEDVKTVIRAISFALLIVPILSVSRGYLQGHKYISASSFSQIIEQIIRIAVILLGSYLCLKVFNLPLTIAVSISVLSAAIGAIIAYIYLAFKMKKVKNIDKVDLKTVPKKTKKTIIKNLINYSIPFIVINIANNIYNTTDMILLNRGLNHLGFTDIQVETISSIFTTWGSKLLAIVTSFATGLVISLIPSMVSSYTKKKQDEVNSYFNKTLEVLLFIILPITLFMSINAKDIWTVFYADNFYGPIIFKYTVLVALLDSAYIMICCALQALYKTKLIYIAVISGLLTNIILDLPLMYLFDNIGIYPFYGTITATVIGYIISLSIPLISLHKKDNFSYKETFKKLPRVIISTLIIIFLGIIVNKIIPSPTNMITNISFLLIKGIIVGGTYYLINFKIVNNILLDKIKKKK